MQTKDIEETVVFDANPHEVYELLMDEKKHAKFTNSFVKISREVGGKISFFDGYIQGKNIELIQDEKIVQDSRFEYDDWPKDHFSRVTFELSEKDDKTQLTFSHTGVPENHADDIKEGWNEYYWMPMKKILAK
jgi:activator of HSP90 ATPase